MTFPRALARYTRGAVNTMTLHFAGHAAFADLEHTGRKSGIVHHAPVRAFRTGETVVVGLNFGRQPDWYRNIKAAGTCRMRPGREQLTLGPPALVPVEQVSKTCPGYSVSRSGTWFAQPNASSCLSWTPQTPATRQ